jgi:hypothetical protein
MNFYDEAIEAKHQLQLDLVRKRKLLIDLVRHNKSVQEVATPNLVKGVLYNHDISVLEDADPYFWDPRITQLVLATGQQLPGTVNLDLSWLRGKAGYWWFGRSSPLIGVSKSGERKYVNALLWNMHPNGSVSVETFHVIGRDQYPLGSLTWDEGENLTDAIARAGTIESELTQMPDLVLREIAIGLSKKVESLADELISVAAVAKKKHEEVAALSEQIGKEHDYDVSKYDHDIDVYAAKKRLDEQQTERFTAAYKERLDEWTIASRAALQLFACGCLWLQQKIVTASQAPLDRGARRRLERQEIDPKCLVVELRSKQYVRTTVDEESKHVDWAWQWAVRGHWRNQPTNDGVKLIWIHPFIKGPEDKPLKPDAARVFAVTR